MDKKNNDTDKYNGENNKGDDTMSASAMNYDYRVIVKGKEKPIPSMTKEDLVLCKETVDKYRKKK